MRKQISNGFTMVNLVLGFTALLFTMQGQYRGAAFLILVAGLFDGVDGQVARRMQIESSFGKEFDSLSDLVSFGVAPAALMHAQFLQSQSFVLAYTVPMLFALCGAVRLARFNTLTPSDHFLGVPITMAGGLLAIFSLLANGLSLVWIVLVIAFLSALMVSKIKIPKY